MRKLLGVVAALFFTASLYAQGPSKEGPAALDNLFFQAEAYRITGRLDAAAEGYARILAIDQEHESALYQLGRILLTQGGAYDALPYLQRGMQLYPENEWMLRLGAQGYRQLGMMAEAVGTFEQLHVLRPLSELYVQEWLQAALAGERWADALRAADALAGLMGESPELVAQKRDIYLQQNDAKGAQKVLEAAVQRHPEDPNFAGLLAQFLDGNGKRKKALKVLEQAMAGAPEHPALLLEYARILQEEGKITESMTALEKALVSPDLAMETKATILESMEELARDEPFRYAQLDRIWAANEAMNTDPAFYLLLAVRDLIRGDIHGALQQYLIVIDGGLDGLDIYQQTLQIAYEADEKEIGVRLLDQLVEGHPGDAEALRLAAFMYNQWEQWSACARVSAAAAEVELDPQMIIGLYELAAQSYFKLEEVPDAMRHYDLALELDSSATLLNNYAWELAVAEVELEKALELTILSNGKKSLEPTFLDTWAWVLYKMNRFAEAQAKIELALQLLRTSPDPTIYFHAAKIEEALGNEAKASEYREKAKALRP